MAHLLRQARPLRHREGGSRVRSEFSETPHATRPNTEADRTTQWVASCELRLPPKPSFAPSRSRGEIRLEKLLCLRPNGACKHILYCKSLRLLVTRKRNRGNRAGATTKCSTLRAGPPGIAKTRIMCSAGTAITRARGFKPCWGDIPGTRRRKFARDGRHGVPGVHAPRVRCGRW
jgi:hypothetical protein